MKLKGKKEKMEVPEKQEQRNMNITELKIFSVPFSLEEITNNITCNIHTLKNLSKKNIIKQAFKLNAKGNIEQAAEYYKYIIDQGYQDYTIFSNYGFILKNELKLKEAEKYYLKAIELKPDLVDAHYNLGNTLKALGKLKEAELSQRKAIALNPDFIEAHSNLGNILRGLGKLKEAELSQRKAIALNPNLAKSHLNLGNTLNDLGKLKEAELYTRKAIELNPEFARGYSNLGCILRDLGKLKESELYTRKAIELDPDLSRAYYSLSLLKFSADNEIWKDQLFSENILQNKSKKDQVDIYFARANILHKKKNYQESSRYLKLANELKLKIKPSNPNIILNKSKLLLNETDGKEINHEKLTQYPESIFIIGMPRSGSTLIESILSINEHVDDLGEINILEESFIEWKKEVKGLTMAELYWRKIKSLNKKSNITTNKNLHNYQYAGLIATRIPNAKIIHCYRNSLDNILSIYRAHFAKGNEYSSSLVDCARVYLDQEDLMTKYKTRFRYKIYDLNYDSLVSNSNEEIKSLISWLGWQWKDSYLKPHLNTRSVSTASTVQVRYPIHSKSIGGWKNYKEILKPAIEILNARETNTPNKLSKE